VIFHWPAPAAPTVAAPAEETAAATVGKFVGDADTLAPVEIPCGVIRLETSALDYAGSNAAFLEFQCKGNSRDSAAYNTNFSVNGGSFIHTARINKHAFTYQKINCTLKVPPASPSPA
jgi:hypothetical protein